MERLADDADAGGNATSSPTARNNRQATTTTDEQDDPAVSSLPSAAKFNWRDTTVAWNGMVAGASRLTGRLGIWRMGVIGSHVGWQYYFSASRFPLLPPSLTLLFSFYPSSQTKVPCSSRSQLTSIETRTWCKDVTCSHPGQLSFPFLWGR